MVDKLPWTVKGRRLGSGKYTIYGTAETEEAARDWVAELRGKHGNENYEYYYHLTEQGQVDPKCDCGWTGFGGAGHAVGCPARPRELDPKEQITETERRIMNKETTTVRDEIQMAIAEIARLERELSLMSESRDNWMGASQILAEECFEWKDKLEASEKRVAELEEEIEQIHQDAAGESI